MVEFRDKAARAAQHVYRKAGFKEIEYYSGNEWAQEQAEGIGIYMKKKLYETNHP